MPAEETLTAPAVKSVRCSAMLGNLCTVDSPDDAEIDDTEDQDDYTYFGKRIYTFVMHLKACGNLDNTENDKKDRE